MNTQYEPRCPEHGIALAQNGSCSKCEQRNRSNAQLPPLSNAQPPATAARKRVTIAVGVSVLLSGLTAFTIMNYKHQKAAKQAVIESRQIEKAQLEATKRLHLQQQVLQERVRELQASGQQEMSAPKIDASAKQGRLSKQQIQPVIKESLHLVQACYESQLAQTPNLSGKVVLKFEIDRNGRVAHSEVQKTTLNTPAVETCIVGVSKTWTFPIPDDGGNVVVVYPFKLEPAQ